MILVWAVHYHHHGEYREVIYGCQRVTVRFDAQVIEKTKKAVRQFQVLTLHVTQNLIVEGLCRCSNASEEHPKRRVQSGVVDVGRQLVPNELWTRRS